MTDELIQKIEFFFTHYKKQSFRKGGILIRAGDSPGGIYYLKQGFVRQYVISKKGDELVVNMFKSQTFFPMMWAVNKTPNTYFYEAVDEVEAYKAPAKDVVEFLKNNPEVMFDLLCRLYRGAEGILAKMTYLMSGNANARLVTEIVIYTKRFGKGENSEEIIVSERQLASLTGMTRETVSREMRALKAKGLLAFSRNKLTIPDMEKLEKELLDGV